MSDDDDNVLGCTWMFGIALGVLFTVATLIALAVRR